MITSQEPTRIAIIGGGIMGVSLAYRLAQNDFDVSVFERGNNLGGLVSSLDYDGCRIDRFYHTILSSDLSMQALIQEAGVSDVLHFTETKQGFYDNGQLYPFNTPVDLLRFPPLSLIQRFRLGFQVIYAQLESDWRKIDQIRADDWLMKVSGKAVYRKVWKPLLRAKFDSTFNDVPATYIWSRLRRMMGTRQGVSSKEMMSYLENGYYTLVEALAEKCEAAGVKFHLQSAIQEIAIEDGCATGVVTSTGTEPFDAVISTLPSPTLAPLLSDAPESFKQLLTKQKYLGVVCPLVILKRSLMPYYVLNITDESIPFTAVVETTRLIDPQYVNQHHLVYLPKYLAPGSEIETWTDEQIRTEWLKHLKRMFPEFEDTWITDFIVQRARYVEPIRPIGTFDDIPPMRTPVERLYMGNTVMIYPELGNGEAVTRFSQRLAQQVVNDATTWQLKRADEVS